MATPTDIANMALSHLGEGRIVDLSDASEEAQVMNLWFDTARRRALRSDNWSCAQKRAALSASVTPPAFGFSNSFPLPADYLRLTSIENAGPGLEFKIEGRAIVTNLDAPLNILYVWDNEDTSSYDEDLVTTFALWLAFFASGKLAPSKTADLRILTKQEKDESGSNDGTSNSPQPLQGGSWLQAQATSTPDRSKWNGW